MSETTESKEDKNSRELWITYHIVQGMLFERAHRILADRAGRFNYQLGIPVVVLTTLVSTSSFASLADLGKSRVAIAVATGLISVLAAVLASLQTFLNFAERGKAHSDAAADLRKIVHTYRYLIHLPIEQIDSVGLYELDNEYSEAIKAGPSIPLDVQAKAKKEISAENPWIAADQFE